MSENQQPTVDELMKQSGTAKAAITKAKICMDNVSVNIHNIPLNEIKLQKSKFLICCKNYTDVQNLIKKMNDEEESDKYTNTMTKFEEIVKRLSLSSLMYMNVTKEIVVPNALMYRKPKTDLPTFSGAYDEWYPFLDAFVREIHLDLDLTDSERFQYLKSLLLGDAATFLRSLNLSDEDYDKAWKMLKERYDHERLIIQAHVQSMFDLPALEEESSVSLRRLVNGMLKHLRALETLGRPTDAWDDVVICVLTSKLDSLTRKAWEESLWNRDMPRLSVLLNFLSHRYEPLEAISGAVQDFSIESRVTSGTGAKNN